MKAFPCLQCKTKVSLRNFQTYGKYAGWCAQCISNAYENEQPWMRIELGKVYRSMVKSGHEPQYITEDDIL